MGRINEGGSGIDPAGDSRLQQLRPWHKSMARMMVAGGRRPKELATIFGLSQRQISTIISTPLFLAEVNRLEALAEYEAVDARTELEMRQPLALEAIDRGLLQGDPDKASKVGFEILDRTGFPKGATVQKHIHLHAHREVDDMDLEDLHEAAMEMVGEP